MSNTLKFGTDGNWAVKEGSALAYNDTNGNFKPLPFTFDRAGSATRVNKQGLIEVVSNNEPRIDFLNDSNGALLLEPSRSNLLTYSEAFENSFWSKFGTSFSVTDNNSISPSGELNASTLNVSNTDNQLYNAFSFAPTNAAWTFSIYAKGSGSFKMNIRLSGNPSTTQTMTLTSDWQRFDVTSINGTSITSIESFLNLDNVVSMDIFGAQVEQGYLTSYIPTQGSIGTRVAETCVQTPPSGIIGQTEGTVFLETKLPQEIPSSSGYFSISDGTENNAYIFQFRNNGDFRIYQNGLDASNLVFVDSSINLSENNKIAFKYGQSNNSMALYVNGVEISLQGGFVYENTTGIDSIKMSYADDTQPFLGNCKDLRVYNQALTDSELISLTS